MQFQINDFILQDKRWKISLCFFLLTNKDKECNDLEGLEDFVTHPQGQNSFCWSPEIDFPPFVGWETFSSSGSQTGRATNHIPTSWRSVSWQGSWPLSISPPLGFFLCQIWTIIRPPGLLQPQLLILTQISPFSLSQLYFSRYIAVSVKVNLRPFLWQLFLANAAPSCSDQIAFCSPAPLTTRAVALTPIAKSECLIPASQEEPPTCNEIFDPSSICLHVPQSALDPGCNGNAFNGC